MDCINVSFPVVLLNCSYALCYHREKLSEEYMESLCIISWKYVSICSYLKFFKKLKMEKTPQKTQVHLAL